MALVAQDSTPQLASRLAPFTGVNNGTARLLKVITASELALLQEGDIVYVESVRDYWKWLPNSAEVDDTATEVTVCAPTVVGGGNGRFVRLVISSPDWIGGSTAQTNWCIASTGNNENSGVDTANALLTPSERQRRWGTTKSADTTAFHIRYLSDNFSDTIDLSRWGTNSPIYVHGSINDREGKTPPLATGTITAVTPLNTATNTEIAITASFANWVGLSGLRIRNTTTGALSYAELQDAVTASKTTTFDWLTPVASFTVAPFVAPANTDVIPAVNDPIVVEDLRTVTNLSFRASPNAQTNVRVVLDSVKVTTLQPCDVVNLYADGSRYTTATGRFNTHTVHQCVGVNLIDTGTKTIAGGYSTGGTFTSFGGISSIDKCKIVSSGFGSLTGNIVLICEPLGASATGLGRWLVGRIGLYSTATVFLGFLTSGCTLRSISGIVPLLYGNTPNANGGYFMILGAGASLYYDIGTLPTFPLNNNGGASAFRLGDFWPFVGTSKITSPALDPATHTYTAERNLTLANVVATVAVGGFGGTFTDPFTGCGFQGH